MRRLIAYHLEVLYQGLVSCEYNKNLIKNIDETHFVINMENGKTLGLYGEYVVKYANVVSSGEAMTMMIYIIGGVHAQIMAPMIIFTNALGSYLIQGVPNILGVCYRSGP